MLEELLLRQLQFGAGGSAGGVFLGSPDDNDSNADATNNTNTGSSDDDRDGGQEVLMTGAIYVGALLLGICCITALTWLLSRLIDRCCCCLPGWRPVNFAVTWDHSALARKARLWGLTLEERQQILKNHVFAEHVRFGEESNNASGTKTLPTQVDTGAVSSPDTPQDDDGNQLSNNEADENEDAVSAEEDPLDDADHERLCCICLAEYQPGDRVLRGETCRHQFHWQCCMEWMAKPQDHCPYCRVLLVSVPTFRKGAIQCLGLKRVEEMGAGMVELTQVTPVAATTPTPDDVEEAAPPTTGTDASRSTRTSSVSPQQSCPDKGTLEQRDQENPSPPETKAEDEADSQGEETP